YFDEATLGETIVSEPVPEDLVEEVERWRERLVEAAADCDERVMERYVEGEEVGIDELRSALRSGTLARAIVPVLCGAALRNRGIQPLLDAVCAYLPAPADIGTIS